jgi:MazG family protein
MDNDIGQNFFELCRTIAALRHPETGCPWDLEQNHSTLRRYMLEEACEAIEVMDPLEPEKLCDELGDVLLQVVLNAQIGADNRMFDINSVICGIDAKMKRRHPHVFGSEKHQKDKTVIRENWESIKSKEKKAMPVSEGLFSDLKIPLHTPAMLTASEIGKRSKKINFDWQTVDQVFQQVQSEINELAEELGASTVDPSKVKEELGDVFFTLAQLCRHLDINPEICARDGNQKFLSRFRKVEELAKSNGQNVSNLNETKLNELWNQAKKIEKK